MGDKHVILRSPGARRDSSRGPSAGPALESIRNPMTVQVDELDTRRISALMREPDVVAVAPSIPMKLIAPVSVPGTPAPTAPGPTWGVKAVGADTSPFTGSGVVVSVLDTGIDASHAAFAGVDITQKDFTGEGDGDQHGHGTHCAGTIFGRAGANTRIGVAEGVTKALIGKVLGAEGGSSDQIVNAIQWAVSNGANVISMSLGMDFPGLVEELIRRGFPPALATSRALEAYRANVQLFERLAALVRVQEAFTQTTVIVAAAGNESERNQNPDFELGVSPPAVSEGIISVAAIQQGTPGFSIASFSNTGATVAGPGVNVLSARPGGGHVSMNGTSMATPHVAGVAALWAEKIKSTGPLSSVQLTSRLVASGVTDGFQAGFDPFDIGSGLVRAPQQ
jgi:subtilisin family serine protease